MSINDFSKMKLNQIKNYCVKNKIIVFKEFNKKELILFIKLIDKFNNMLNNLINSVTQIENNVGIPTIIHTGGKGGKSLDNEDNFITNFNTNIEYRNNFIDECNLEGTWNAMKPNKKNGIEVFQTNTWNTFKDGTKEKYPSPKTDVVLVNSQTEQKIGISIKSGSGRATSADAFETNAILLSVLKEFNDDNLEFLVNELVNNLLKQKLTDSKINKTQIDKYFENNPENTEFESEFSWYKKFKNSCIQCNNIWSQISINYPDYKYSVIKECLQGRYKFAENIGKADFLVILESSNSVKVNNIIDLNQNNEDLRSYCSKIGNGKCFAAKSTRNKKLSSNTLWQRFL
jgi:hypothetical protein